MNYNSYPPYGSAPGDFSGGSGWYNPNYSLVKEEKKDIKYYSRIAGICVLGYILVQQLLGSVIYLSDGIYNAYFNSPGFQSAFGILLSLLGVLLPFFFGATLLKSKKGLDVFRFSAPKKTSVMLLLVPVGFMVCIAANYLTNIFVIYMEDSGFSLESLDFSAPTGVVDRIFYFLQIAVVPPLCEELAVRGVVMQPLRKYGDRFAVIASALVFAIMHGNLVQAPFALIVGLVIGYAVCVTDSLWTGILIHFVNNAFSCFIEFMFADIAGVQEQNLIYYATLAAAVLLGVICAVVLVLKNSKELSVSRRVGLLPSSSKAAAYIFTLPMVIALLSMLYITSGYISWNGNY